MAPKRKCSVVNNQKNEKRKVTKKTSECAAAGKDGARKVAKNCNQRYLMEALDTAMTQVNGESYTKDGLAFVAVNSTLSLEDSHKNSLDPLNLSQTIDQVRKQASKPSNTSRNTASSRTHESNDDTQFVDTAKNAVYPAKKSTEPAKKTTDPAKKSTEPPKKSTDPAKKFTDPAKKSTEPPKSVDPAKKSVEPAGKSVDPVEKPVHPAKKSTDPTEKSVEPAKKSVDTARKFSRIRHTFANLSASTDNDRSSLDESLDEWRPQPSRKRTVTGGITDSSGLKHPEISATDGSSQSPKRTISGDLPWKTLEPRRIVFKRPTTTDERSSQTRKRPISGDDGLSLDASMWEPPLSKRLAERVPPKPRKRAILFDDPSPFDSASDESLGDWTLPEPRRLTVTRPFLGDEIPSTDKVDDRSPFIAAEDDSLAGRKIPPPRRLTLKKPTTGDADGQPISASTPKSAMIKDIPTVSPDEDLRESDDRASDDSESEEDENDYRSKYFKLFERYQRKSETCKNLKKNNERLNVKVAELKDLVVFANSETRKAQSDPNAKMTFTTDPEISMTAQQIEEISAASKSDVTFGQNLAMFFYGAKKLQTMSVTGIATHRFKNAMPRPGISPKKLSFIYEKVKQRIASRVGANNLTQISTLGDETRINKGIAEKISNLRKAAKIAAARDII